MKASVERLAELLGVHPRTIARYTTGRRSALWADGTTLPVGKICRAFGCPNEIMVRVLQDKDRFVDQAAAAEILEVCKRTIRDRKYKPAIRKGAIVRYSVQSLMDQHFDMFPEG